MTRSALLAYCLGISLITVIPTLTHAIWIVPVGCLCVMLSLALPQMWLLPPERTLAFVVGVFWHLAWAQYALTAQLEPSEEGEDRVIVGRVVSPLQDYGTSRQFLFNISQSEAGVLGLVQLNYYGEEAFDFGQRLELVVRLNRPHGLANPGVFDREAAMLSQRIRATGYVRSLNRYPAFEERLSTRALVVKIRAAFYKRLVEISKNSPNQGLVLALVLGEKGKTSQQQRDLFAATGTSHLFVISGLHIGLVAGVAYYSVSLMTLAIPFSFRRLPRQTLAGFAGLGAAAGYALLAGFTLPTQRALIMLTVFMLSALSSRQVSVSHRFLVALALVLTIDPLATLGAGFWFSFTAVASLLVVANFSPEKFRSIQKQTPSHTGYLAQLFAGLSRLLRPQMAIALALLVPLTFWGASPSLLSPLTNTVVIPLVGFLLVPLCLTLSITSFFSDFAAGMLLRTTERLFSFLLTFLEGIATSENYLSHSFGLSSNANFAPNWFWGAAAVAVLMSPAANRVKLFALIMFVPYFWPETRGRGFDIAAHVLDVGQGLAVIVQSQHHTLVYDTGFGIEGGYSLGDSVLLPALKYLRVTDLDTVVVSHGDADHIGGLRAVLSQFPRAQLISNADVLADLPSAAQNSRDCIEVKPWHWDGIDFEFLTITSQNFSTNNNSCVLKISHGRFSILLPGDIERAAERLLVQKYGNALAANVLVAPHHGSNSSSSYPLLKSVRPDSIIVSAGYNNRFDHPAQTITDRYSALAIDYFLTAEEGMISLFYQKSDTHHIEPLSYRKSRPRYWR